MMQRKGKASGLLMLALAVFTGCTQTDYKVGQTNQRRWRPIDNEQVLRARTAPAPKILPETHFAAGVLLEQQGQPGQAIEQFRRAVVLNHRYAEAYHRLGVLLGMTGQHVEAEQQLRQAVALKPQQAFFHNDLGFELMQRQEWAQAEAEFRAALELYPRMPRANINLALAVSQQGRFDEALACFRTVLPEADAQFNLGLVYKTQQRYSEAADCFRRALVERPLFTAAGTQLVYVTQSMNADQSTPSLTPALPLSRPGPNTIAIQSGDSTIQTTPPRNELPPQTLAAGTISKEPTPTFYGSPPVDVATAPHQPEWMELQPSFNSTSDDPMTVPGAPERTLGLSEVAFREEQPSYADDLPPARSPETAPTAQAALPSQPDAASNVPQPTSTTPSADVQFVPLTEVGGAPLIRSQHSTPSSPSERSSPPSSATTSGFEAPPQNRSITPDEFRDMMAERRAQAAWLEQQRTGRRAERKPAYFHESKYETQVLNEPSPSPGDTRSTMAATVDFPTPASRGQGPLPAAQPLDWLEALSPHNAELEMALNNLRCEAWYGSTEPDYSPIDFGVGFEALQMTIVPPESPALPLERVPAAQSRPTTPIQQSNPSHSTIQPTGSGEKIVPMTDPTERSSRR